MSDAKDLQLAAKMGPKQFKETHAHTSARDKLEAAEDFRQIRVLRMQELEEQRRAVLVNDGWLSDEELRRESLEVEQDIKDFDVLIAELRQHVAAEDAAERQKMEQAAAAAEAERQAERKQARAKASTKLDKAFVNAESVYQAWLEEQRDLPLNLQNRKGWNLRAALFKLAPGLAQALQVERVAHNHQRSLAEVSQ